MNITGIITEYNPFHKGHLYHIRKTREITDCDCIVCVMSGNFVQRGTPAILDKWQRTEIALKNGVDLILELPMAYSISSAEFFSFGAISLLNELNIINNLCFGSELGNLNLLSKIAEMLIKEPIEFKNFLSYHLNEGLSYPKARNNAISEYFYSLNYSIENLDEILNSSNNILALEYLKSLIRLNSKIKPFTIKREGGTYNSTELLKFSSATAIRKYLKSNLPMSDLKNYLPYETFRTLEKFSNDNFVFEDKMIPYLKYKILSNPKSLTKLPDVKEGLENRLIDAIIKKNSFQEILEESKSKRYALTRLSRILCQYYVGFDEFDIPTMRTSKVTYARILGFNSKGRDILKELKKNSNIPLITKLPKIKNDFLNLDIQGTKMYSLLNSSTKYNDDYLRMPIIIK